MTDDEKQQAEKRAAAINDLIDTVPMREAVPERAASADDRARKTCVCCGANALASDADPVHLIGCRYGKPPEPGCLTHRVECRACGSVGFLREGMPPFTHLPTCTGDGTLVGHQDRCAWVIGGAVATAGTPCRELAAQVRFGRLLCATHADLIDSVDAWSTKPRPMTFAEQVEATARELAWVALPELNRAVFRKDAVRKIASTPREQVRLPGVDPKP